MRIVLDYLFRRRIGNEGISEKTFKQRLKELAWIREELQNERGGNASFCELPYSRSVLKSVIRKAELFRKRFRYMVVVGIGGSSLGARTLIDALSPKKEDVKFLDNIDPYYLSSQLRSIPLRETLVCVVTKSGSTAETVAVFLILCERLKRSLGNRWRKNLLIVTDPERGPLRRLARRYRIKSLSIPPYVPGRFSVFTPSGLLPAAFAGVNVEGLLDGAARMDTHIKDAVYGMDTPFLSAVADSLLWKKKRILVLFTYSSALRRFADWASQLWAESLGKRNSADGRVIHTGQTPLPALGVTDQHSLLQLFAEGPHDKVYNFIEVKYAEDRIEIPLIFTDVEEFIYLAGKSLKALFESELSGTRDSLVRNGRPVMRLILEALTPVEMGAIMQFFMVRTVYLAKILSVNPFDQPGVELGKKITYSLMGRKGYEDLPKCDEGASPMRWEFKV